MRPGYLQRNGVPYSANAVVTEYLNRVAEPNGDAYFARHDYRRRPAVSEFAVCPQLALQARAGRFEMEARRRASDDGR